MDLGCSSFSWETKDKKHLLGRTYDQFGNLDGNKIVIIPSNYELNMSATGKNMIKTKYCFTGMGIVGLDTPIFTDGINEKGLMGALLRYPGFASYNNNNSKDAVDVNPGFFLSYTLGMFSSIVELCSNIERINLTNEKVFGHEIPVHYIFSDSSGETVIIEPDEDGMKIYRNSIGVLTNSPDFLWHEKNLRNYVGLDPSPKSIQKICGKEFRDFGFTGLDIPGSYSSVSRFVRIALLKTYAKEPENELDGITKMFHNFSSVDIPAGVMSMKVSNGYDYQMTLCMAAMCSESLTYYFNLATNRRICAVNLKNEINNKEIKYIELPHNQDISYLN